MTRLFDKYYYYTGNTLFHNVLWSLKGIFNNLTVLYLIFAVIFIKMSNREKTQYDCVWCDEMIDTILWQLKEGRGW